MTLQAALTLADGQSTPVSHTFDPRGARNNGVKDVAVWRDQSGGIAAGFLTLKEEHASPNANGIEKFRYVFDVPVLEQASSGGTFVPPPTKAFSIVGSIEVFLPERATESQLKDIVAYLKNFTSSAYFSNAITKRDAAW